MAVLHRFYCNTKIMVKNIYFGAQKNHLIEKITPGGGGGGGGLQTPLLGSLFGYRFLPIFDGNSRVLAISAAVAKLNAFFWLDLIKLMSFLADNILSSASTQRNTNHSCN